MSVYGLTGASACWTNLVDVKHPSVRLTPLPLLALAGLVVSTVISRTVSLTANTSVEPSKVKLAR